jgi:histidyl-tRNA synthetase
MPAVGASIGIDRVLDIIYQEPVKYVWEMAFIATISAEDTDYAIGAAETLRASGASIDINMTDRNISKQLEHANSVGFKHVIIIGKQERDAKKVRLRDLVSGKEEMLDIEEVSRRLAIARDE